MSLAEDIFQDIDNKFGYVHYIDVVLVVMKSNGYFNASRLCHQRNLTLFMWNYENPDEISKCKQEHPDEEVVIDVLNDSDITTGVYLHFDLLESVDSYGCFQ